MTWFFALGKACVRREYPERYSSVTHNAAPHEKTHHPCGPGVFRPAAAFLAGANTAWVLAPASALRTGRNSPGHGPSGFSDRL